jgi:hypothetical protein
VDARDALVWQLVDERIAEVRGIPYDELAGMVAQPPQTELVDRDGGRYRRRTRVLELGDDRVGVKVAVDADGRRPRAERCVILAPEGRLAPEWTIEPMVNPFVAGPRVTIAGVLLAVVLFAVFLLLI